MVLETTILPLNYTRRREKVPPETGAPQTRNRVLLVEELRNLASAYGTSTLTDGEAETLAQCYWCDEVYLDRQVVTRHYHLCSSRKHDLTSYVRGTEVELWTVLVVEWSMATALFLLQDVYLSLKLRVGF